MFSLQAHMAAAKQTIPVLLVWVNFKESTGNVCIGNEILIENKEIAHFDLCKTLHLVSILETS